MPCWQGSPTGSRSQTRCENARFGCRSHLCSQPTASSMATRVGVIGAGSVGSTLGRRLLASNRFTVKYGELWRGDQTVQRACREAPPGWYLRQREDPALGSAPSLSAIHGIHQHVSGGLLCTYCQSRNI